MLKQRVLTALVLAPLVLGTVLFMPSHYLALIFALVLLLGGGEWARLAGISQPAGQLGYILLLAGTMLGADRLFMQSGWAPWLLSASLGWWLLVIFRISRFSSDGRLTGFRPLQALEGVIVLVPAWFSLVFLHHLPQDGPVLLVFLLMLIWGADVGAYFAGRRWGRHKLAPQVSPGKTREGVYGALVPALLFGLILGWWQGLDLQSTLLAMLLCLITVLFSVVGDLSESMLKRQRSVKDSGNLLPGHGGMLDRVDSLTAAAPVFLLGWVLLDKAI
ncbi:MAG: phosphatidate cytidylyltransferase [Pseudomonadota bacterium]